MESWLPQAKRLPATCPAVPRIDGASRFLLLLLLSYSLLGYSLLRIARRRAEPGWRAAVLDERAKRVRKAAATERQPQRAERAMGHGESGGVLSSASDDELGRSKAATTSRQKGGLRASANRAPAHGGEGSRGVLSSASDDDGGGSPARLREQPQIKIAWAPPSMSCRGPLCSRS